jgi:succinate dehydrogenase / fumarate reductase iron-sulfur subunit
MKLHLKIWRQRTASEEGRMVDYDLNNVSPDMSFLEMLDVLNEELIKKNEDPIAFDHDCRSSYKLSLLLRSSSSGIFPHFS